LVVSESLAFCCGGARGKSLVVADSVLEV
jgi:hypothetical protein